MNIHIEQPNRQFKKNANSDEKCLAFVRASVENGYSIPSRALRHIKGYTDADRNNIPATLTYAIIYVDGVAFVLSEDVTHYEGYQCTLYELVEAGSVGELWTNPAIYSKVFV